jgi:hypothetical protein
MSMLSKITHIQTELVPFDSTRWVSFQAHLPPPHVEVIAIDGNYTEQVFYAPEVQMLLTKPRSFSGSTYNLNRFTHWISKP